MPFFITPQSRMAGLWTAHREIGMPFDISLLMCREADIDPDWLESVAVAIKHCELPSLDAACGGIPDIVKGIWMAAESAYGGTENAVQRIIQSRTTL